MRPNSLGSLRWIAAVLLFSGCYRPWMQPGAGYGGPMYGNQYYQGGYGGYQGSQGIQTLTPGNYYDPNTGGTSTYSLPNNLQPQADPNSSGSGSGSGAGDGGNAPLAPPYNPSGSEVPKREVPMYPDNSTGNEGGSGIDEPLADPKLDLNDSGTDGPAAMSEPALSEEWADGEPIQQAGLKSADRPLELKPAETAEETPPLLTPQP